MLNDTSLDIYIKIGRYAEQEAEMLAIKKQNAQRDFYLFPFLLDLGIKKRNTTTR